MHDATEGGVLGGVLEMSSAAGMAAHVNLDTVDVPSDILDLTRALALTRGRPSAKHPSGVCGAVKCAANS